MLVPVDVVPPTLIMNDRIIIESVISVTSEFHFKEKELLQFLQKYLLLYFQDVVGLLYRLVPSKTVTTTLTNEVFKQK